MTLGMLSDKGMNEQGVMIARISVDGATDQPFEVLSYALPFLEKCEKGGQVEFTTKDRKISKIAPVKKSAMPKGDSSEKRQAAGFDNPPESTAAETKRKEDEKGDARIKENDQYVRDLAKQSGGSCTSPAAPAGNGLPKTLEGKLSFINTEKRSFNLWNEEFKIAVTWAASHDADMAKFKQWDLVKVTYEVGTVNRLIEIVAQKKKGGWGGQPVNQKAIIFQVLLKGAIELMVRGMPEGQGVDLKKDLGTCIRIAEEALPDACKAAGVS